MDTNKTTCPNCHRKEFSADCGPCGASNRQGDWCRYYEPSNGTEGMWFTAKFCENCLHQHPDPLNARQCNDILLLSFIGIQPAEWIYDENREPTCTAFQKWDWGGEDDGWNEPPDPEPIDPNQLVMPFTIMEILGDEYTDIVVTPTAIYEPQQ